MSNDEKRIRIAWKIDGRNGYGFWHSKSCGGILLSHVDSMNREYGDDTHWIEEEKEIWHNGYWIGAENEQPTTSN